MLCSHPVKQSKERRRQKKTLQKGLEATEQFLITYFYQVSKIKEQSQEDSAIPLYVVYISFGVLASNRISLLIDPSRSIAKSLEQIIAHATEGSTIFEKFELFFLDVGI